MVILDYDQKIDVETMNEVLFKTIDGGALRKEEFVIAVSQKKLSRKGSLKQKCYISCQLILQHLVNNKKQ